MSYSISQKFNTGSLFRFALPSIIMMLFCAISAMMGSIISSNYISQNAMAAINITFPIAGTVLAIAIMFATGANAIISKNLGEGNFQKAKENFTVIIILGILVGFILSIITLLLLNPILHFLGATTVLEEYCKTYLNIYAYAFPFVFLQISAQYFFVTVGKPMYGMIVIVLGGMSNIILNIILVAWLKIGMVGTGIAIASSFVLPGLFFGLYFLLKRDCILHFVRPKCHKNFIMSSCTNGSSEMVTNLAFACVTALMNHIMLDLAGETGLAAVSVIVQTQFLLNSIYIGFGAGVAPIFGFAYGKDNREQTKTVFKISLRFVLISSILLVILCQLLTTIIVGLFISPDSAAYTMGKTGFRIFAFGYLFAGFNIFSSVFFTSLSNGKLSAFISFLRTFMFILGMLMFLPHILGTTGVWLAIPIAEVLASIVSYTLLKTHRKVYHY